jgi:hypothetical protein
MFDYDLATVDQVWNIIKNSQLYGGKLDQEMIDFINSQKVPKILVENDTSGWTDLWLYLGERSYGESAKSWIMRHPELLNNPETINGIMRGDYDYNS